MNAAPGGPLSVLQILEKGLFSTGSVVQMYQLARRNPPLPQLAFQASEGFFSYFFRA